MSDRVRVRNDFGTRLRGGPAEIMADPGDVVEMSAEHADYYVDEWDFTIVEEAPFEDEDDADESETEAEETESDDVDEWAAWNEDDWLDLDYQQRATDVREGRVDDYLGQIEACETSETVEEAVEERRAELGLDETGE